MSVMSHFEDLADDRRPAFAGADSDALGESLSGIAPFFSPAQATPCPVRMNSKVNEVSA